MIRKERDSVTNNCPFCEIAAGRGRASVFYEDDLVLGFMDINPVTPGHALVIPKAHAPRLADLDEATGRHLFTIGQRTAAAIRASGVTCEGINLFVSDGEAAGQEVYHVHLHVIARFPGDGFRIEAHWDNRPSRSELDEVAARIRVAYADSAQRA